MILECGNIYFWVLKLPYFPRLGIFKTLKKASSLERIKLGYKVYFSSRSELQREYNLLYDQFGLRQFGLITTGTFELR